MTKNPTLPQPVPVAYRAKDPEGDGYLYFDDERTVEVYRRVGVELTPLYAAPTPQRRAEGGDTP